jgi:hypothetical protein
MQKKQLYLLTTLIVAVSLFIIFVTVWSSLAPSSPQIIITNSGSTNSAGWELSINSDGSGTLSSPYGREDGHDVVPSHTYPYPKGTFSIANLTATITKIGNITGITGGELCMKSVSFGTETTISFNGQTSGDISCIFSEDPVLYQQLAQQVDLVLKQAELGGLPRD